jgi:acylphosphatase
MIRHYLISGRVQGVGFRAFVRERADRYQMRGWVRNLADGRVEVLAGGAEELHELLADELRQGPLRSRVTHVEMSRVESFITLSDFAVISSGEEPWGSHEK